MNLSFVGYGSIAASHARAFGAIAGVQLHSVVGRRLEATQEFADEFGFARVTFDLDEALADDAIDAVVITSPHDLHADQTARSLRAGKHVLCEIPLAMNLRDVERVTQLADECGRTLMVAHTQRYEPALIELRRRVIAGEFHPHHVVCRWFFFRRENVNWLGKRRSWVDDLLWHHGCHVVDAVGWVLGTGVAGNLLAQRGPLHSTLGIPLDLSLCYRTQAEQLVTIAMSYNSPQPLHDYAFIGDEDTLTFADGKLLGSQRVEFEAPIPAPIPAQDAEFLAAIREGRAPLISGHDVLPAMAILQSAQDAFDRQ